MVQKLYVGNMSYDTTENTLRELFTAHGEVVSVNVVMDRYSGRSRGFAFVEMESDAAAQAAIAALNGKNVDGRELTVNVARPREDRAGGGGGGGSWGGRSGGDRGGRGGGDRGGDRGGRGGGDRNRRERSW